MPRPGEPGEYKEGHYTSEYVYGHAPLHVVDITIGEHGGAISYASGVRRPAIRLASPDRKTLVKSLWDLANVIDNIADDLSYDFTDEDYLDLG